MSSDSYARPSLPREHVKECTRRAEVAAIEAAAAVLRLPDPGSSVLNMAAAEERFMLACRDVYLAVEAMDQKDRPKGWDAA